MLRGILFFCLVIQFSVQVGYSQNHSIIDLSDHDFIARPTSQLSGKWEFYYHQLLTPEDFKKNGATPVFIDVPGSWNRAGDYPVLGYATFKTHVILPENQFGLMLYIPVINSSSTIWVNGQKRSAVGVVSDKKEAYRAYLKNVYLTLPEFTDSLEIVIQVANFTYFSAGLATSPQIGKATYIFEKKALANGVENVFAGSLIAMFLYQFILYFLYNRGKPNLWLALICLGVALRSMILNGGSFLLPNLFPDVPYELWKKIEFGSVYLITAIFPLYIHHLFKNLSSQKLIYFFVSLGIFLGLSVIFMPQYTYGKLLDVCHVGLLFSFIYAIYTVAIAWRKGNSDAKIIFFGVLASFPFILLEILNNTFLININFNFEYLVELGVLVFLLFQVYILARHYANSFKSLEVINRELELEIAERTMDLVESSNVKERLLSVISHDVKSPLTSLQSLISMFTQNLISKEEFDSYFKRVEGDLSTTIGLVENILYWTASQRKGQSLNIQEVDINALIKENISQLKPVARKKNLTLNYENPIPILLESDKGMLNFIIRNLISNAIKFSHQDGEIEVNTVQKEDFIGITIQDFGLGMTQEQQNNLFKTDRAKSTEGTHQEQGTGIGLNLCREFILKLKGELTIASEEGKGSAFTINLPWKY